MKRIFTAGILCALLLLLGPMRLAAEPQSERPNILLIVGDDIGFGDLGFAGAVTRTPNIDRLAEKALYSPAKWGFDRSYSIYPGGANHP